MRMDFLSETPAEKCARKAREAQAALRLKLGREKNMREFGRMPDGTKVWEVTLRRGDITCKIITYGAAVRSLLVPDRDGNLVDVVLGFDTLEDYLAQDKYLGATVGRYANRIGGAKFTLNGQEYPLAANDGENSLHGGKVGFSHQVWTLEKLSEGGVTLSLTSPHMQEGYPGTLTVKVTYSLMGTGPCMLSIGYWAKCDRDTVFNPTNHTYFNLSGHDSGPVTNQLIRLWASRYTPTGPGSIPTGELAGVEGTPMDLREWQPIGAHIDDPFDQLAMAGGYDHNWAVDWRRGCGSEVAAAQSPDTGIYMEVCSDMPGVQFYTGNYLDGCPAGKRGAVYGNRCGFCLETQFYPDSPNRPEFPTCVLKAGEEFRRSTTYVFYRGRDERDAWEDQYDVWCDSDPYPGFFTVRRGRKGGKAMTDNEKKALSINACRVRMGIIEGTYAAKSGHPGGSLSSADLLTYLYFKELNIDPAQPQKPDRDRFVLSKGHCAPGLYAALALRGFFPWEDLKTLRHVGSHLQGHPNMNSTPGVDMSTGSLGQGVSAACGMALAARYQGNPCRVYALLGDGEIEEGEVWEALMFAAHYKLDNLCVIIDNNGLQIDGPIEKVMSSYPIVGKLSAFGFGTVEVDGHDFKALEGAFAMARAIKGKPFAIVMRTTKGKGVSFMENQVGWHGKAPNAEQYEAAMAELRARLAELEAE